MTRDTLISKRENQAMFDDIARRYDLMNRIISLSRDKHWRQRAIDTLAVEKGAWYLDVGTGTGDIAIDIKKKCSDAVVVGLDPAAGMLNIGRQKSLEANRAIHFMAGDAMFLPFESGCFDGVIVGFCIRNVECRSTALKEFYRVLKPKGRLVILELTPPTNPIIAFLHRLYTGSIVPLTSLLFTQKGAYDYLVKSVRAFPTAPVFQNAVLEAGFAQTTATPLMLGSVTLFFAQK